MDILATNMMIVFLIVLVLYLVISCIRIVPQAQAYVIELLGHINVHGVSGCTLRSHFWSVWQREYR